MIEFDPSIINTAISILFLLVMAIFTLSSAIALYSLVSYGKSRFAVVAVTITYCVLAVSLFFIALNQYHQIKF